MRSLAKSPSDWRIEKAMNPLDILVLNKKNPKENQESVLVRRGPKYSLEKPSFWLIISRMTLMAAFRKARWICLTGSKETTSWHQSS